ncbi:hypothetical protein M427DRAFT_321285 [Gonapodya prolifera JEL478]|uniref:Uncharacterized protein n=1 Tax=Gonapodya prolifera (strain JEL478) TaxID=1344416 RepID=A0A139AG61_GONPJ|nr:hypothetical protein M427DRAFT_321285 [Gonapodya prolifera JEL478]|eukprot:KXS15750.1 hypothetical protein M427DRAFT_321285 [Gonapodya prolifera JEL478]
MGGSQSTFRENREVRASQRVEMLTPKGIPREFTRAPIRASDRPGNLERSRMTSRSALNVAFRAPSALPWILVGVLLRRFAEQRLWGVLLQFSVESNRYTIFMGYCCRTFQAATA